MQPRSKPWRLMLPLGLVRAQLEAVSWWSVSLASSLSLVRFSFILRFVFSIWFVAGTDRLASVLERFVTAQQAPVVAPHPFPSGTEQMCDVLKEALGKPRDWGECNLGERLVKHKGSLLDFLPLCSWPPMLAVRLPSLWATSFCLSRAFCRFASLPRGLQPSRR